MIDSFRPNDILKAKVISLGDSSRSLYLTTAAEDLGVVVAKAEQSGRLMLPYDWTSMIDLNGNHQEKRKVAKPEVWVIIAYSPVWLSRIRNASKQ